MNKFDLRIVTPEGIKFEGQAESLLVTTAEGEVQILANHAPYVAYVTVGRAKLVSDKGARAAFCGGGFLTVGGNAAELSATTFEFADEIDVERAQNAKERAERRMKESQSRYEQDAARAKLMRAVARLSVASAK